MTVMMLFVGLTIAMGTKRTAAIIMASEKTVTQTAQDVALHSWYKENQILCTSSSQPPAGDAAADASTTPQFFRSDLQVATTKCSVGGRGVFWTSQPPKSSYAVHRGDILAHIPGQMVLLPSNLQGTLPFWGNIDNVNNNDDNDEERFSWQCLLASYCWQAWRQRKIHENILSTSSYPRWGEWIETWSAGGDVGRRPRKSYEYTADDIEKLARLAHSTPSQVKEVIQAQYKLFENDWNHAKNYVLDKDTIKQSEKNVKEEFGRLYRLVLSRTTNLGPEWANQMGIIPLHDMINHPPVGKEANVELFCLGDIRGTIGNENLKSLLQPLMNQWKVEQSLRGVPSEKQEAPALMDRDFVLAARDTILPGDELFLSYKTPTKEMSDEEQIWLLLQYGFPFQN